jgi:type IV pilus assembly protein PilO
MTSDFYPMDPMDSGPEYPTVFGIAMTPAVSGILLGLLGLGAAAAAWFYLAQPEFDKSQQLSAQVEQKKEQLLNKDEILKQIEQKNKEVAEAKQKRQDVLKLFANEDTMNTLLMDLNQQIKSRNQGVASAKASKLATCPGYVRQNVGKVETQMGEFATEAKLLKFEPNEKDSGVITDSSYGAAVNSQLKRKAIDVSFSGNYGQTQEVLRSIERLQPLLVLKAFESKTQQTGSSTANRLYELTKVGNQLEVRYLPNCQPDTKIESKFRLEALLPLSDKERQAAANAARAAAAAAPK